MPPVHALVGSLALAVLARATTVALAWPDAAAVLPTRPKPASVSASVVHAPQLSARTDAAPPAPAAPAQSQVRRGSAGEAALASLDYPWERLGYRVVFRPYRGGRVGLIDTRDRTITVFVKPHASALELRTTIAHELGHALDLSFGTPQRRADYVRLRGLDPRLPWFPCSGCTDYRNPAGDFAEVFALWLAGPGDFRGELAPPPGVAELARLVPLFRVPTRAVARTAPTPRATQEPRPEGGWHLPVIGPPPN